MYALIRRLIREAYKYRHPYDHLTASGKVRTTRGYERKIKQEKAKKHHRDWDDPDDDKYAYPDYEQMQMDIDKQLKKHGY